MPKYRIVQAEKINAVKQLIMANLGPPRYIEYDPEELIRLYPNIPVGIFRAAAVQLVAEGKIEVVP